MARDRPHPAWLLLYLTTGPRVWSACSTTYIKIRKQRSLGLNKRAKLIGQTFIAVSFGVLALLFRGRMPA